MLELFEEEELGDLVAEVRGVFLFIFFFSGWVWCPGGEEGCKERGKRG